MARMGKSKDAEGASGLGDAELVLLASGGRREDRLIELSGTMKPATRQRAGANLLKRALAEERPAQPSEPVWCERDGVRLALEVTLAGLKLIGIVENDAGSREAAGSDDAGHTDPVHPKDGTRGALLVSLLSRPEGASLDDLMAATGWLPHTTRAALSGLRKRGFAIARELGEAGSRYRIPTPEPEPERTPARRRVRKAQAAPALAA